MVNNGETYSSNEKVTPTSIERGIPGGSFDKLAGAQQRIASQKNEGPSQIAESRISDAKWAELGGRPRNPTPEFETPTPTSSTQPLEVGNTTDMTPQNTTEQTINTPPKNGEIEAGNGKLVSIGHKEVAIPESGDITVSVGAHPATKGTSETPIEESSTTEAPIVGEIPTPGAAPEGDSKDNATQENTIIENPVNEDIPSSWKSLLEGDEFTKSKYWEEMDIGEESALLDMPGYILKVVDDETLIVCKRGNENDPEYTYKKGSKSEGNEGVSVNKEPTKTPTAPESRDTTASEKEPSATSEEVDTSDIPKGFEKTIKDPMMDKPFTWENGRWVAPKGVEAFDNVASQKGAGESLAYLINQSAGDSIPEGYAYQFVGGKFVIAPKKN